MVWMILISVLIVPDFLEAQQHTFQCPQYDIWDATPWTYEVPIGDFCSTKHNSPLIPDYCTKNERREAPKILIHDGEGTDCILKMYESPGKTCSIGFNW